VTRRLLLVALIACGPTHARSDGQPHSADDCTNSPIGGMGYIEYRWSYFGATIGPFWDFVRPIEEACCIPHTWGNCAS
jgi:hypothetical protein